MGELIIKVVIACISIILSVLSTRLLLLWVVADVEMGFRDSVDQWMQDQEPTKDEVNK